MKNENRRQFLQKMGLISLAGGISGFKNVSFAANSTHSLGENFVDEFTSLLPKDLFTVLNMELLELEKVKATLTEKGYLAALNELLKYYRSSYPKPLKQFKNSNIETRTEVISRADDIGKHIFQWGHINQLIMVRILIGLPILLKTLSGWHQFIVSFG
jgi:hypothetical protein